MDPVHIDDRWLNGDRYKILYKLGYGASSTVWLARDRHLQKYVALKIKEAGISKFHNELDILKHISKLKSDHPGRIYSPASLLLRRFWIDGPSGRHLALVFQGCGPSISRLYDWNIRLRTHLAQSMALQITKGHAYLHYEGICCQNSRTFDVVLPGVSPPFSSLPSGVSEVLRCSSVESMNRGLLSISCI